jgi:hypothetical protein
MLLRNKERYAEVLEVGIDRESRRRVLTRCEVDIPTSGFFFDLYATTFGLAVSQGALFVLLQNRLVPFGPGFKTQMEVNGEYRVFTASRDAEVLVRVKYLPAKPFWNFFPMEDEDVDGFLWIHNVLSSAERQRIMIDNNSG